MSKQDENVVRVDDIEEESTNVKSLIISMFLILLVISCLCVWFFKFRTSGVPSDGSYDIELKTTDEVPSDKESGKFNFFKTEQQEETEQTLEEEVIENNSDTTTIETETVDNNDEIQTE